MGVIRRARGAFHRDGKQLLVEDAGQLFAAAGGSSASAGICEVLAAHAAEDRAKLDDRSRGANLAGLGAAADQHRAVLRPAAAGAGFSLSPSGVASCAICGIGVAGQGWDLALGVAVGDQRRG